jgi:hypothetical protein
MAHAQSDFSDPIRRTQGDHKPIVRRKRLDFVFRRSLNIEDKTSIGIVASPMIATSIAEVDGKTQVFLANFAGLHGGVNPVQIPQTDVHITLPANAHGQAFFLPFLGEVQELEGMEKAGRVSYALPPISKGAVFWYQPASNRASAGTQ